MTDNYGSDFTTIVDEDGTEYELEILTRVEYNGYEYMAVVPADGDQHDLNKLDVAILKTVEEDGEPILCAVMDEQELESVEEIIMQQLFEDSEE